MTSLLSTLDVRRIAVAAMCDERTVRAVLAHKASVRQSSRERVWLAIGRLRLTRRAREHEQAIKTRPRRPLVYHAAGTLGPADPRQTFIPGTEVPNSDEALTPNDDEQE